MVASGIIWICIPIILFKAIYLNVDSIAGWGFSERLVLVGTYTIIDSIMMFLLINNMVELQRDIVSGQIDLFLTKPIDPQFYLSFRVMNYSQLFNVLPGLLMVFYGFSRSSASFDFFHLCGYLTFLIAGMILYYCIWLIWTVMSFWFPNIVGRERLFLDTMQMARFPSDIYKGIFGFSFQYLLPIAFIANPATKILFGKLSISSGISAIVISLLALVLTRYIWKRGLVAYSGTGS
ncbi:hypothetical protein D3C73_1047890 [compost metagenome]